MSSSGSSRCPQDGVLRTRAIVVTARPWHHRRLGGMKASYRVEIVRCTQARQACGGPLGSFADGSEDREFAHDTGQVFGLVEQGEETLIKAWRKAASCICPTKSS